MELDEDRFPLHQIVQETFPILGEISNKMLKQQENAKLYPTSSVEGSNSINASVTMIPATKESMNCDPQHHGREMGAQRREQGCEARGKEHG